MRIYIHIDDKLMRSAMRAMGASTKRVQLKQQHCGLLCSWQDRMRPRPKYFGQSAGRRSGTDADQPYCRTGWWRSAGVPHCRVPAARPQLCTDLSMVIVDSSVWVDFLKSSRNTTNPMAPQPAGELIAITSLALTEVLQGIRDDRQFRRAQLHFSSLLVFDVFEEVCRASRHTIFVYCASTASRFEA